MIKLLFSCGPFSNLEIEGIQSIQEAKQKYDECVHYFGEPKEASPKKSYSSSGGRPQRAPDVPKEQQKGAPNGQVMQVNYPCGHCNQPLKESSKGNAYCSCWYQLDPMKAGALPPQAPAPVQ